MIPEDVRVGRLLSRRELVALLSTSAACLMGRSLMPQWALATPGNEPCVVRPEQTEGPNFVDERLTQNDCMGLDGPD